jgi:hypothetical protein
MPAAEPPPLIVAPAEHRDEAPLMPEHSAPRWEAKRDRDSDCDSDSSGECCLDVDGDGGWSNSPAGHRMVKRRRQEAPGDHPDPARNLMAAAHAATVEHTMAMKMERKLGVLPHDDRLAGGAPAIDGVVIPLPVPDHEGAACKRVHAGSCVSSLRAACTARMRK